MNNKHRILTIATVLAAVILTAGCASPEATQSGRWTHAEGRTPQQIEQDLAACRILAHQPGGLQGGNAAWYLATRNGSRNDAIVRDCMIAKGYTLTPATK